MSDFSPASFGPPAAPQPADTQLPTWSQSLGQMITPDSDISRRLQLIRSVAPSLMDRMDFVMPLAQSGLSDDQLLTNASAAMGTAVTHQEAQAMSHMDQVDRTAVWERMTPERQHAFIQAGFDFTPQVHTAGPTGAGGLVGHALGAAWRHTGGELLHEGAVGVGGTLHALGMPLRAVQHTYRGLEFLGANHTFDGAWSRTANGERYFTNTGLAKATDALGDQSSPSALYLAQRVAAGATIEKILNEAGVTPGTPEYSTHYRQLLDLTTDDHFSRAVQQLHFAKVSPGRDLGRLLVGNPNDNPGLFNLVSGLTDASFTLLADPLLVAGKFVEGARAAKYAVDLSNGAGDLEKFGLGVEHLPELDRVAAEGAVTRRAALLAGDETQYGKDLARLPLNGPQRYAVMVSDHFGAGDRALVDHLAQTDPRMTKVLRPLTEYDQMLTNGNALADPAAYLGRGDAPGITNPSDFVHFLTDGQGLTELASGRWGSYAHRGVELPHMSAARSRIVAAKINTTRTIDFIAHGLPDELQGILDARSADASHLPGTGLSATQELQAGLMAPDLGALPRANEAVRRVLSPVARTVQALTTLKPTRDVLQLAGESSYESLSRFLSFAYRGDERARIIDAYFAAAPNKRIDIIKTAIPEMARRLGVLDTQPGRDFIAKVASSSEQHYARWGEDLMQTGTGQRAVGIMPEVDQAWGVGLPGYDELLGLGGQARRMSLQHLLFGSVPATWGDAFLGAFWKPSVLMRIGFVPRVAGEEALGAVARLGAAFLPGRWLGEIGNQPDFVQLGPFRAAMDAMRWHIPTDLAMGDKLTAAQQARELLARMIEATGRAVTPIVRAGARGGQAAFTVLGTPLHEPLATAAGRRLFGGEAPEFGSIGDRIQRARDAITEAQQSSASASLAKQYFRIGHHFEQGQGLVTNMDPAELEERLRLAGRLARDPRVQDAHARMLAQAWGKVSSSHANLITAGDDPLLTSLERGPNGDLTPVKLQTVGSKYVPYGRGDQYFDASMNWSIGRLAHDRVAMADAAVSSLFVHPDQAAEVAGIFGGDGFEQTQRIRTAVGEAPYPVREALRSYFGAPDPEQAMSRLNTLTRSLDLITNPLRKRLIKDLVLNATELSPGTRNMLIVDRARSLKAMQGVDLDRTAAQLYDSAGASAREAGIQTPTSSTSPFLGDLTLEMGQHAALDEAAGRYSESIAHRLEHGDDTALTEARREAVRRRLMAPDMAQYRDLSERNAFTADGSAPMLPVPAHHARLHAILMDPGAATALQQAPRAQVLAGVSDPAMVNLVSAMLDEGSRMSMTPEQLAGMRTEMGQTHLAPVSSIMLEDPEYAQRVADAMGEAMLAGNVTGHGVLEPIVGQVDIHRNLLADHTNELAPEHGLYRGKPSALVSTRVEDNTTSYRDVVDDWVSHIIAQMDSRTKSQVNGRVLHEVTRPLLDGDWGMAHLAKVASTDLPAHIVGPQYMLPTEGLWSKMVRWGFDKVLGPGIDAMIREPLFAEHFMQALQDSRGIQQRFEDPVLAKKAQQVLTKRGLDGETVREAFRDLPIELTRRAPAGQLPDISHIREHLPPKLAGLSDRELLDLHGQVVVAGGRRLKEQAELLHDALPIGLRNPLSATIVDAPELRQAVVGTALGGLTDGELGLLRAWHGNLDAAENLVHGSALDRATNEIIPFIHDHRVRSQFSEWTRHIMPFEFAEEQFLKRWSKTLSYAPEALEKGQLLLHGLRSSGMVQKDTFGNDVFVYPGSAVMTRLMGSAFERFTGRKYTLPLAVPLVGDIKYTLPGMNQEGLPGVSPFVALSMGMMRRRFPELDSAEQTIVGQRGAGHSVGDMILPRQVMGLYHYWTQDPNKDAKLASASIQVMTMMAAKDAAHFRSTGEHLMPGLADDATNNEWETFIERSVRYTRSLQLMRSMLGYVTPAAPTPLYEGDLHPYLTKLLQAMPDNPADAFSEFINQYPDASAYEVFGTKTQSGMPLPSSKAVQDFLENNRGFVSRYKYASSVLAPPPSSADEPSKAAYRESLATELRINKAPKEWYQDWKFASAAPAYFASRDAHDQLMATLKGNPGARNRESMAWSQWEQEYFTAHPIFHEQLTGNDAKTRRLAVLDEMGYALYDPEVPTGPHVDNLRDLLGGVHSYQAALVALGSRRDISTTRQRNNLKSSFNQWVKQFTQDNPDVSTFYARNIEPDLSLPAQAQTQVVN